MLLLVHISKPPLLVCNFQIVLTGIGADELFGGYTRHRNAYKRGGWLQLESELWMDWQRIASRNLARDDRVIGHHGRQPRMPYLDERFVEYVLDLPAWKKLVEIYCLVFRFLFNIVFKC